MRDTNRRVACALAATLLLAVAPLACGDGSGTETDGVTVAVSVLPHAWLVERIGGEHVTVVTLVGPGESPATYQPTDQLVSEAMRARLLFRTGVPFERGPWLAAVKRAGVITIDLRAHVPLRDMEAHDHGEEEGHAEDEPDVSAEGKDPHIWLAPALLRRQAMTAADALAAADPEHAETYRANFEALDTELAALDGEIRQKLENLPTRRLYVFHPAWGYFCDAYGLTQVPIEIEGKDPSERELTEIVKRAKADDVKVIYVQPQITGRAVTAVAEAIGARVERLDPIARDVPANLRAAAESIAAAARDK